MTHLWVRAESRANEERAGITPEGVASLVAQGFSVTVEDSPHRVLPTEDYARAGAVIAPPGSWPTAPDDAIVFGLKELPDDGLPLRHRHVMFGHAFKGQPAGQVLLRRFQAGGGHLYDLEYLTDDAGRRLAAFGYWAGYAGAAVSLKAWVAQQGGGLCGPVHAYADKELWLDELRAQLDATARPRPHALVIGAKGRVGTGAADLLVALGVPVTRWDMAETAHGGPFPEVLAHDRDGLWAQDRLAAGGLAVVEDHPAELEVVAGGRVKTWRKPRMGALSHRFWRMNCSSMRSWPSRAHRSSCPKARWPPDGG